MCMEQQQPEKLLLLLLQLLLLFLLLLDGFNNTHYIKYVDYNRCLQIVRILGQQHLGM